MLKQIPFLLFLWGLCSCSESFHINDEWSDLTIVYGVLNQNDTAHYIKVNKAFLGDVNVYEMAKEADSIQYAEHLKVQLVEYEIIDESVSPYDSNNWYRTDRYPITLQRTNEINKDTLGSNGENGIFGTEVNYLYKTSEKLYGLNKYILEIKIPDKPEIITSETILIRDLKLTFPPPSQPGFLLRMENYLNPLVAKWETAKYGKIFQPLLRLRYMEIIGTDTTLRFVDIVYPEQIANNIRMPNEFWGEKMNQVVGGEAFFSNIGRLIEDKEHAKRKVQGLEFIFYIGGNNLSKYLSVSNATAYGYKPVYSNIVNGTGIFAARYNCSFSNARLSDQSLDSLAYGIHTRHLNFANYKGVWE